MATITVLRPSSTSSGVGWSASPSGTLHGVTSDDNDATAALWSGAGSEMILATPLDAPPVGERRHLVRLRARGEDGQAWWAVRLASGALVAGAAGSFGSTPETIVGSWQAGAPPDGSSVLSCYVSGQTGGVRIVELFLDVDTRQAPTFTPQVLDGTGTPTVTVTDTNQPTIRANALDLDGLPARWYRYWVTLDGAIVWDTGATSGASVNRMTAPLENGTYVAHLIVASTIGSNTLYQSAEQTLEFDLAVGTVPAPDPPVVTPQEPFYEVGVCAPDMTEFDDDEGFIEIQRVDCPVNGYLELSGSAGAYASTPSATTTADLQVTVHAQRDDGWRPAADQTLVGKYETVGDLRSWRLSLDSSGQGDPARAGRPFLIWSPDGTFANVIRAHADERPPIDPFGAVHLRASLDVDDGAGNWVATFETQDEDGTWVPLGNPVTVSGTTSLFDTAVPLTVGAHLNGGVPGERFEGRIYSAQVRDGVGGTIVASPNFTGRMAGTTTFTDDQANVWTVHAPAAITNSQVITTIAMLGPLATDECDEWTDYTFPRTGVAGTCEHDPELCCSYYRARTVGLVDGSILVSNWSDSEDPDTFCLQWTEEYHLIRTTGPAGAMYAQVGGRFEWDVTRPFTAATGVMGSRFVTSAPPGGRNLHMVAAVESQAALLELRSILGRPLVLISPSDATELWAAPVAESVRIVKIDRIRQVTADFIATGPEPGPQIADVGA